MASKTNIQVTVQGDDDVVNKFQRPVRRRAVAQREAVHIMTLDFGRTSQGAVAEWSNAKDSNPLWYLFPSGAP
ncbi:hypothetical protein E4U21_003543 [Claviceps maximensis]|nr:hypothetical protein E4U21_003543 [Claviceps maximensis]